MKIANKSVIWYNPEEFKKNGWAIPKTWKQLVDLSARMAKAGKTPWSIKADIGWPLFRMLLMLFSRVHQRLIYITKVILWQEL